MTENNDETQWGYCFDCGKQILIPEEFDKDDIWEIICEDCEDE